MVDNPHDPGGLTNMGISLRRFPYIGADGIRKLTKDEAVKLYLDHYWTPAACEELPGLIRLATFDAAIHSGPTQAIRLLQRALNKQAQRLQVDGIPGIATRRAAQKVAGSRTLFWLQRERQIFLQGLPHYPHFADGWEIRILDITFRSRIG